MSTYTCPVSHRKTEKDREQKGSNKPCEEVTEMNRRIPPKIPWTDLTVSRFRTMTQPHRTEASSPDMGPLTSTLIPAWTFNSQVWGPSAEQEIVMGLLHTQVPQTPSFSIPPGSEAHEQRQRNSLTGSSCFSLFPRPHPHPTPPHFPSPSLPHREPRPYLWLKHRAGPVLFPLV